MPGKTLSKNELIQLFKLDDEIIDVEVSENGLCFPVVRAYDDERVHFHFWCIHCRKWHIFGRGDADRPYKEGRSGMAGHRSAQCTARNSPFNQNGVILHIVGKFSEAIRKKYRKGTALRCPICRNQYSAAFNACDCGGGFVNKRRKSSHPALSDKYQEILSSIGSASTAREV